MSRVKLYRMRLVGLIVSFGFLVGCFFGSFCGVKAQAVKKIVGLKGGIEYQGNDGSNARNLNEREIVRIAVFMYGLAKNYIREFGFKDDNAKGFIKEFLKNSTEHLSKKGFKLEIQDLINTNITDDQLKKLERIQAKDYSRLKLNKADFADVKKEVLAIARACKKETQIDSKSINKVKEKDSKNAVVKFVKNKLKSEIKKLEKEGRDADKKKIEKLNKLLKNRAGLRKYAVKEVKEKSNLYKTLVPSLKERVEQIKELEYEDVKGLNNVLNVKCSSTEK